MAFRPLHDKVLVKRELAAEKSAGGIIIPDGAKEKPVEGEVMAAGPGHTRADGAFQEVTVKRGDRVLFGKYAGTEIKLDGVEYVLLKDEEILGVVEP